MQCLCLSRLHACKSKDPSIQPTTAATQHQQQTAGKMASLTSVRESESERRFRVVVYGIEESPPNTPRYKRSQHDLDKMCGAIPVIDSTSIKDFFRLGKFRVGQRHPRPILITFLWMSDVTTVLSNRDKLVSPIAVKPAMTAEKRNIESLLLHERWNLIQNGMDHKQIKIAFMSIKSFMVKLKIQSFTVLILLFKSVQPLQNMNCNLLNLPLRT